MQLSIHREPDLDNGGIRFYSVTCVYQAGSNLLRLLAPDHIQPDTPLCQLYVLPVNPGVEPLFGDGLQAVKDLNLHNRYSFLAITPSFSDWPWYADHPSDPLIRQESYMMNVIVPLVDELYPASGNKRLLLGFSKSGVGAFSLLLRHPDVFHAAAAWDAPLMKTSPDEFEMPYIYETQDNFNLYCIPGLLEKNVALLKETRRLALLGYGLFRDHLHKAHALMDTIGILHDYEDGPEREHRWDSGWLEHAVNSLAGMAISSKFTSSVI